MYTRTYILKQHTPIIHFQSNLKDATIRPTELKAKLDKFIIGKWTGSYGSKEDRLKALLIKKQYHKHIKNGYDFEIVYKKNNQNENTNEIDFEKSKMPSAPSLDYKVKVKPYGKQENINDLILQRGSIEKDFKIYFGNMKSENPKIFSYYKEIELIISSTNEILLNEIENSFSAFFFNTNFGTRQNKGFGSFYLHNTKNNNLIDRDYISKYPSYKFKVDVSDKTNELDKQKKIFSYIDYLVKIMKAGVNRNGLYYFKPTIWHYLYSRNIQWDKKTIKNHFYKGGKMSDLTINKTDTPDRYNNINEEKNIWRDLLGYSSLQKWDNYPIQRQNEIHNRVFLNNSDFKRFSSPITFKPLRKDENTFIVFIIIDELFTIEANKSNEKKDIINVPSSEIFNQMVNISNNSKKPELSISFPNSFDYKQFLYESFKLTYTELKLNGNRDIHELKDIFSQLNLQNPYNLS